MRRYIKGYVNNFELSVAVAPCSNQAAGYDGPAIAREVDFINVMFYDLHGKWEPTTANHAAMGFTMGGLPAPAYSVKTCAEYWLNQQKVPIKQLILGIPLYGNAFALKNLKINGVGAPAWGVAKSPVRDNYLYSEICRKNLGWTYGSENGNGLGGPYAYLPNGDWVGYDNKDSASYKALIAKSNSFGGIMFWSIDQDDVYGACGDGKFPVVTACHNVLTP